MTRRILEIGFLFALLFAVVTAAEASERRMTPLVRAIQRVQSSVVNIHTVKTDSTDSLFGAGKSRKVNGMGTGVVIDERGYAVTNYHVIHGIDSMRVTLHDGGTFAARVVSFDRAHDLAIIKLDAGRPLPVMPSGTSSDIMLGESVIAVGNAFGYEHTVTSGIISALSRDVEVNEKQSYRNLIQTDASINPGNSGGPLLNLDGEVIGINVAIRAGAQRIGFAIPIDDARRVIARLMSVENVDGKYHGLILDDVKQPTVQKLIVETAEAGSPAAQAGFLSGDVVLRAGSIAVTDAVDFERALLGNSSGKAVDVEVRRGGENLVLKLSLASANGHTHTASRVSLQTGHTDSADKPWEMLGLQLSALSAREKQIVSPRYRGGMKVMRVRPNSPADQNGIREGDVLVGLHIWETISYENITYVLEHDDLAEFNPLKFYIIRSGETLYGHLHVAAGE